MKYSRRALAIVALLMPQAAGAQQQPQPQPRAEAARQPVYRDEGPRAGEVVERTGGSLLRAAVATRRVEEGEARKGGYNLFSVPEPTPRTIKKHDLVTIIVREESSYSSEESAEFQKEANFDASVEQFVRFNLDGGRLSVTGDAIGASPPRITMGGTRDFAGEGSVDREDRFSARITGEVIDVKPNGNIVLQARKRIKTDEEEQMMILSGTCRAEDITADNSVLSTQLFDLDLEKSHKGGVRDSAKRGLVPRLFDFINPF